AAVEAVENLGARRFERIADARVFLHLGPFDDDLAGVRDTLRNDEALPVQAVAPRLLLHEPEVRNVQRSHDLGARAEARVAARPARAGIAVRPAVVAAEVAVAIRVVLDRHAPAIDREDVVTDVVELLRNRRFARPLAVHRAGRRRVLLRVRGRRDQLL